MSTIESLEKEIADLKKELIWHKIAISTLIRQMAPSVDKVDFMNSFSDVKGEFFPDDKIHPESGHWIRQLFSAGKNK